MIPQVSLVLHEPDSGRVLRRALENYAAFLESAVVHATRAARCGVHPGEVARAKRRAAEFQRRLMLAQQLVAQLPDTGPDLTAPKGD